MSDELLNPLPLYKAMFEIGKPHEIEDLLTRAKGQFKGIRHIEPPDPAAIETLRTRRNAFVDFATSFFVDAYEKDLTVERMLKRNNVSIRVFMEGFLPTWHRGYVITAEMRANWDEDDYSDDPPFEITPETVKPGSLHLAVVVLQSAGLIIPPIIAKVLHVTLLREEDL